MFSATKANSRTATAAAEKGSKVALSIAFYGGSIMGLCVASLGLVGLGGLYFYFGGDPATARAIEGFGMGGRWKVFGYESVGMFFYKLIPFCKFFII